MPPRIPDGHITLLPQEILDFIFSDHLYLIEQISLRLTCRRLYLRSPPMPDLYMKLHQNTTESMILAQMVERDLAPEYRACGKCHRLHHARFFSAAEMAKDPWYRGCRGITGSAVVNPATVGELTFRMAGLVAAELDQAMDAAARKRDADAVAGFWAGCEEDWPPGQAEREEYYGIVTTRFLTRFAFTTFDVERMGEEEMLRGDRMNELLLWMDRLHFLRPISGPLVIAFTCYLDLETVCGPQVVDSQCIAMELRRRDLDFLVCPHMRMGDTAVAAAACEMHGSIMYGLVTGLKSRRIECGSCATMMRFTVGIPQRLVVNSGGHFLPEVPPYPCLKIDVVKNMGRLRVACEEAWLAHTTQETELICAQMLTF
jgi:hypothetical protein